MERGCVDGDGIQIGRCTADMSEACFTLIVLYIDTRNTFQCITNVRVGKRATWSAEITLEMLMLFFCCAIALYCALRPGNNNLLHQDAFAHHHIIQ